MEDVMYFVQGTNSWPVTVDWYITDPNPPYGAIPDPRFWGGSTEIAFTIKKNIPEYPNAWIFQAWVGGDWYQTSQNYTYGQNWTCQYIAVKPFITDEAHELPTGLYTWLDDDVLLGLPAAPVDAAAIKAAYGLPDTVELVFPP
jgi:hypothetical protein